jgi:hypothetical protein
MRTQRWNDLSTVEVAFARATNRRRRWLRVHLRARSHWYRSGVACLIRQATTVVIVGVVVICGMVVGSAWAFVTASGSGSNAGSVATATTVTVSGAAGTPDLIPGGKGATYFTLKNTNALAVTFTTLTAASVASNTVTACPNANVSMALTVPYTLAPAITVAAHSTTVTEHISTIVQLAATAPSGCQGMTFKVSLTFTGKT